MEITINSQSKTISFRRGTTIKDLLSTLKDLSNWEDYVLDIDNGITISSQWSGIHYIPVEKMVKNDSGNNIYFPSTITTIKTPNFGDDKTYTNLIVK